MPGKLVQARKLANGKIAILVGGKKIHEADSLAAAKAYLEGRYGSRYASQRAATKAVLSKVNPSGEYLSWHDKKTANKLVKHLRQSHGIHAKLAPVHGVKVGADPKRALRPYRVTVPKDQLTEAKRVLADFKDELAVGKRKNVSSGKTIGRGRTRVFHPFRSSPDYDPSYLHDAEGARARKRAKGGAGKKAKKKKVSGKKSRKPAVRKGSKRSAMTRYRATENPRLSNNKDLDVEIKRIPLDRQGYTKDGQYFGVGQTLWDWRLYKESTREEEAGEKRANSKADVLSWLKGKYPHLFAKKNPKAKSKSYEYDVAQKHPSHGWVIVDFGYGDKESAADAARSYRAEEKYPTQVIRRLGSESQESSKAFMALKAKHNPKAKRRKSTGKKRKIPAAFLAAAKKAKAMTPAQRAAWAKKMQAARKAAAKRKGK